MPNAPDGRPLLVRLNARIQKYSGCTTEPLAVDIALHQQSVEELGRLATENTQLRKHIEGYRQIRDAPLLEGYAPFRDLVQADLDDHITALRAKGLSIDGDNAYKRDLCDSIVGALALGAQNSNPPPPDHWGRRFWDIGREERAAQEDLLSAAKEALVVINRIKPAGNGNGTQVRLAEAIAKADQQPASAAMCGRDLP
ncbi:hypothetical protein [Pseudomonas sp.]|uniref:hypothetical protein n=1 Tax=Pseudomonas sp. TaxID=306 RepID=UPI003F99C8AB